MPAQSVIGDSKIMQEVLDKASKLATIDRPVLITGARGTGKELIAERLHYLSKCWTKPLLKVNCLALNESLLASELFGHEAGSFTGAIKLRRGRFELAEGGSLFLDEIANTSQHLQESLLRVVEYGEYERIGGQHSLKADVRIIAASNVDLREQVAQHHFRADLLDRLAFDVITLPPLKERGEDCLQLADFFALNMAKELNWPAFSGFSDKACQQLLDYDWPGNVRELKQAIERSLFYWDKPDKALTRLLIDPFTTPLASTKKESSIISQYDKAPSFKDFIGCVEQEIITHELKRAHFHQGQAARALGISYHSLRAYLKKYRLTETPHD